MTYIETILFIVSTWAAGFLCGMMFGPNPFASRPLPKENHKTPIPVPVDASLHDTVKQRRLYSRKGKLDV